MRIMGKMSTLSIIMHNEGYVACTKCIHFEIIAVPIFLEDGTPDGATPEPFCEIHNVCVFNTIIKDPRGKKHGI